MPNPNWQYLSREQLFQDQLQRERQEFQEFQAWKLEMTKNLVPTQSQAQAPSLVDLTEPPVDIDAPVEVTNKPRRSARLSAKRSRSQDQVYQAHSVSKRARSATTTSTSQRSVSPKRDYPRGTSTVTRPTPSSSINVEDRPVQAQDLANFKTDMTSFIQDIQSSLNSFASQFKANSGSKGDSSQDLEEDQVDHVDPTEEEVELASEMRTPICIKGILICLNWY